MTWCADFFDNSFAEQYLERPYDDEMKKTVKFLQEKLHLQDNDIIFDQCCGIGSVSLALAKNNYQTIAVDLIDSYIKRAKGKATKLSKFYADDAYKFTTNTLCDAAVNWWTSFGYDQDDSQNIKMLERIYESLKPGKYFALDYMNSYKDLSYFKGKETTTIKSIRNGYETEWNSKLNQEKSMLIRTWIYTDESGNKVKKQGGGARLFTPEDFERMLSKCGFINIKFYGSVMGESFNKESPRCIAVAQKENR